MAFESLVGISASILTGIASIPQLLKINREKQAENISLLMYFVLVIGLASWTYYGLLKKDIILIASNGFSFLVNSTVLVMSIIYKGKGARDSQSD